MTIASRQFLEGAEATIDTHTALNGRSGIQRSVADFGSALWGGNPLVPRDLPRVHAAGPDIQRTLLIECGMLGGFGVLSHELSLAGHLAREVRTLSGRGQIVDVINCPRPQAGVIVSTLASQPLWRFDAVVIVVPAPSVFGSLLGRRWDIADSQLLVEELERLCSFGTRAVIVGVGGESPNGLPSEVGAGNSRTFPLFEGLRKTCPSSATAEFVQIFGGTGASDTRMAPASEVYQSWANIIGPSVSAALSALPGLAGSPFHASAHDKRDQGQDEGERLAAIDALGWKQQSQAVTFAGS